MVWVLQHCAVVGDKIASPSQPIPFDEFTKDLPTFRTGTTSGKKKTKGGYYEKPASATSSSAEPAVKKLRGGGESSDEDEPPLEELDEPGKLALRNWLAEKKVELQNMRDIEATHFIAGFRGSSWTAAKRGVGSDCAMAEAQTDAAAEWAKRVIGNKMASFSIKRYGEDVAGALACLWSDRMEFFYSCHVEGMLVGGCLTPELRAAAPQPTLCQEILATKDRHDHPGYMRLTEILLVEPRMM